MNKYETVIGLEIHVQLKTKSKMFCACDNTGEDKPANTTVCPICLGHPGILPTTNEQAVKWSIMASLALNCGINMHSHFDRKSYYYPDLPKGYQISQFDEPFGHDGHLIIKSSAGKRRVRIERAHLEEDTGKLMHEEDKSASYVDYNRAGTPLLEVVTRPDLQSPQGSKEFLQELRLIMRYLGISDANMEKGQLRCDANISLRPNPEYNSEKELEKSVGLDAAKLYPKTEIKNLNSFKSVEKALEYEITRQTELWEKGEAPTLQSTRGWDEKKNETVLQRVKEEQHDYRYFPEPDIPPFNFSKKYVDDIKVSLSEMPYKKRQRFQDEFKLSEYDSNILVADKDLANYFEKVISELQGWIITTDQIDGTNEEIWDNNKKKLVKSAANWIISRLLNFVNSKNLKIKDLKISPENFAELLKLVFDKRLNNQTGVLVLNKMFSDGGDPSDIMESEDLGKIASDDNLEDTIDQAIKNNKKVVEDYESGKENAIKFLVGQVMKDTKGRADANDVLDILISKLK
ncbi:MAG: Asp-tRNA(Asn)/Glu-tRNA(Gln) amidotransferase subunit GatB [candidate division Zixibacteria bacterium]|nr:Asp-tRNA(Asn)/Glu-tRNA(Gln) amidotransferase subunit GatB [candidate division Zixibacteria bacterium]